MDRAEFAAPSAITLDDAVGVVATPAAAAAWMNPVATHSSLVVPLFAAAMFLSAFLLFMVEPMVARMVLPILGGAPMVWNACVVFFQTMLLAGYGYAYGASTWMGVRRHAILHSTLLLIPFAFLPLMIDSGTAAPKEGNPILWLLILLTATIGVPFFVLSTTASVLQHWLSRTDHPAARDPYFLYGSSNLGSLLALAAYPTIVEPVLTVRDQSRLWAMGYGGFVVLTCACAAVAWRRGRPAPSRVDVLQNTDRTIDGAVSLSRRALWVALAFIPSSLMLAVTSYMSTDIAAMPLLWIVPLALYLLTFVIGFGSKNETARAVAHRAVPLLIVSLALFMVTQVRGPLSLLVPFHLMTFTAVALLCHAELAHDRPAPSHLTEFYFWISFGGMLGGLFNTLAAPLMFNSIVEYPLVLVLACLFLRRGAAAGESTRRPILDLIVPLAIGALTAAAVFSFKAQRANVAFVFGALVVPAVALFAQRRQPLRFGVSLAAMLVAASIFGHPGERVLHSKRTFFGVYRVSVDPAGRYHALTHGVTLHGMQALDPLRRREALTYFHRTGPFGQALAAVPPRPGAQIAVVGLGVGTLATYAEPGQLWTFYEIDPAAERIARTTSFFTYLSDCASRCRVVLGDARVSLAGEPQTPYDVIVLDAFTSDAIPVHLMTREALSVYLARLAPHGVIAFHISSQHLVLSPVVARLAASHNLVAMENVDRATGGAWAEGKNESHWVVLARRTEDLGSLEGDGRWVPLVPTLSTPLWTDDFSNILGVIRFR